MMREELRQEWRTKQEKIKSRSAKSIPVTNICICMLRVQCRYTILKIRAPNLIPLKRSLNGRV